MKPRKRRPGGGRKRDPQALRRTGVAVSLRVSAEEHAAWKAHARRHSPTSGGWSVQRLLVDLMRTHLEVGCDGET